VSRYIVLSISLGWDVGIGSVCTDLGWDGNGCMDYDGDDMRGLVMVMEKDGWVHLYNTSKVIDHRPHMVRT
jgi:hypothetical protein